VGATTTEGVDVLAPVDGGRFQEARAVFDAVALSDDFVEFLTLPAYEQLD
jgi:malate synthase